VLKHAVNAQLRALRSHKRGQFGGLLHEIKSGLRAVEPASGERLPCCSLKVWPEWTYRAAVGMFPLSPPQDQQCAGALMWVWVTYAYLIPAVVITVQLLSVPNQQPLNTTPDDVQCRNLPGRAGRKRVLVVKKAKTEKPVVLTVGHSTRTWKDFLRLLRVYGVRRVIDVRSIPRSRHNPQFNRDTLSKKLRSARIGYVLLRKLGGLRRTRRDSVNMGWRNTSFRGFADYMQTPAFGAGLDRLMKLAAQKRNAIMCAEAVPWHCHRSLIADALTVRGIRVEDIMSMKHSQIHSLTPFARVQDGRITYPAERSRESRYSGGSP